MLRHDRPGDCRQCCPFPLVKFFLAHPLAYSLPCLLACSLSVRKSSCPSLSRPCTLSTWFVGTRRFRPPKPHHRWQHQAFPTPCHPPIHGIPVTRRHPSRMQTTPTQTPSQMPDAKRRLGIEVVAGESSSGDWTVSGNQASSFGGRSCFLMTTARFHRSLPNWTKRTGEERSVIACSRDALFYLICLFCLIACLMV